MTPFITSIALLALVLGGASFLFRRSFCIVMVRGTSMAPLLSPGDRLLVFRWYPVRRFRLGQIVVLTLAPNRQESSWLVKRIVARGGEIFSVDSAPLDPAPQRGAQVDDAGQWNWHIPPGYVFVCGDNRKNSTDSRHWGPVPAKQIMGLVLLKLSSSAVIPPEPAWHTKLANPLPIGSAAPAFCAETLSGETVTLEKCACQSVLLLFISNARFSPSLMSSLAQLTEELALRQVAVFFVYEGTRAEAEGQSELLFPAQSILLAPRNANGLLNDYQVRGTPSYCLLDSHHLVQATGYLWLEGELEALRTGDFRKVSYVDAMWGPQRVLSPMHPPSAVRKKRKRIYRPYFYSWS